ncbi:MAG TPA: Ig-like domain-containing protein, partial [Bacillota bacterium]|nr:Ig-like domain-containing protein [Bacillota bacterium]
MVAGCQPAADVSEHVELVADLENLGPAATFELRFDQPMAPAGQIGTPLTNSPLVITPSLPGSFTWLNQRSGTFTPAQALAMDTRYELTLAPGLCDAQGKPVQARLHK